MEKEKLVSCRDKRNLSFLTSKKADLTPIKSYMPIRLDMTPAKTIRSYSYRLKNNFSI